MNNQARSQVFIKGGRIDLRKAFMFTDLLNNSVEKTLLFQAVSSLSSFSYKTKHFSNIQIAIKTDLTYSSSDLQANNYEYS